MRRTTGREGPVVGGWGLEGRGGKGLGGGASGILRRSGSGKEEGGEAFGGIGGRRRCRGGVEHIECWGRRDTGKVGERKSDFERKWEEGMKYL